MGFTTTSIHSVISLLDLLDLTHDGRWRDGNAELVSNQTGLFLGRGKVFYVEIADAPYRLAGALAVPAERHQFGTMVHFLANCGSHHSVAL